MPKRIKAVRERGGKVIVIDPRRTETAELADQHIPIRPGTDAYFLFAIIHHLFASGRVDLGVAAAFSKHLDIVAALPGDFSTDSVASVCGVPAEVIRQLLTDFDIAKNLVWVARTGPLP